jgi:predicted Rossmann fold nucleotide-binding protein DprA/Smf involved in DNA uptake
MGEYNYVDEVDRATVDGRARPVEAAVLEAVRGGATTAPEVRARTGAYEQTIAGALISLERRGLIVDVGPPGPRRWIPRRDWYVSDGEGSSSYLLDVWGGPVVCGQTYRVVDGGLVPLGDQRPSGGGRRGGARAGGGRPSEEAIEERRAAVLEAVREGATVPDVAVRLGIPEPGARRVLLALEEAGVVERLGELGREHTRGRRPTVWVAAGAP